MLLVCYDLRIKEEKKRLEKEKEEENSDDVARETNAELNFDRDEIARMREMARKLSQKIEQDKLSKFMKSSNIAQDSGSDSRDKTQNKVKNTDSYSNKDTSLDDSKGSANKSGSDLRSNSQENSSVSDRDRLKHYKIKKKPSSQNLNIENSGVSDLCCSSVSNRISEEQKNKPDSHKRKHERDNGEGKREKLTGEPAEKRSKEKGGDHKEHKHTKKRHRRKDASKYILCLWKLFHHFLFLF